MGRRSAFEGWTKEKQCFGLLHDSERRMCAIGWLELHIASYTDFQRTIHRIAPLLRERFPGIDPRSNVDTVIVFANDVLRLDPEVFRSLDQEAIDLEESRLRGVGDAQVQDRPVFPVPGIEGEA